MGNDYFVIRNGDYTRSRIHGINDHNERRKESYRNVDIVPSRSRLNVHFRAPSASYTEMLDAMVATGKVSLRGLKKDAVLFDEFVIDINSRYFEEHGGYKAAQALFAVAYQFCCEEVGEQNILSAVVHADEQNQALTQKYGHNVWHYHMHVVYLPTVRKEILYSKRCKDKSLVGTVKSVITQVSHSKRWESAPLVDINGNPVLDENGKPMLDLSYGQLQTRFAAYMKEHGYADIERGVAGKKAKHKSIVEYKLQQDEMRAKTAAAKVDQLERISAQLTADITVQQEALTDLQDMTEYAEEVAVCRTILQQIFDAITTFFSRTSLLRDKKAETKFSEQLRDGLVNFFQRLRNLLGFELLTDMPLELRQSPQLAEEGEKLALSLQIAEAKQRTDTPVSSTPKRKDYDR